MLSQPVDVPGRSCGRERFRAHGLRAIRTGTAFLAWAIFVPSSSLSAQRRPMTVVDLISLPSISEPHLSPACDRVVYVKSEADWARNRTVSHLFLTAVAGGSPVQLTYGEEGESSPRWSPDGTFIAFLAERGSVDGPQIHLLPTSGGEARPLTRHPTAVRNISWAPDGRAIYFLAADELPQEEREKQERGDDVYAFDENFQQVHLWRVDIESGQEERVTQGDYSVGQYAVSRDGSRIALIRSPTPLLGDVQRSEVWVMGADGSSPFQLTRDTVPEQGPELSPDGTMVLFRADSNERFDFYYNDKIFLVPAGGGEARVLLPDFPGEISGATWSDDGASIFFVANMGVRQELFRASVRDGTIKRLTEGDHALYNVSYEPACDMAAFTVQSRVNAGDVAVLDLARGGGPVPVTHYFDELESTFLLPRQEAIQWTGEDGVTVEGLLFYPTEYQEGQRYPLIVQTHGGPASSDKFQFGSSSNYIQVLAAKGYFVLKPNYRGSTGYGDAFLRDMVGHYFHEAHRDVMAGVDHLIEEGMVDPERMGAMGWSAGGHMTNKLITYTDRFKAASSGAGASNWISMYAQSDVRVYRTPWFGGNPWEEGAPIEVYWENSPLKDAGRVKTPTIFLVGERDARVPMPQSVEMYRALKANGVPTHLYVAPRQGHGWRELYHRLFKANVELDWFEQWIMEREYTWETPPAASPGGGQAGK